MSHPKRSSNVKKDIKLVEEVLQTIPSSTTNSITDSHVNFISSNYHYANLLTEAGKLGFANVLGDAFNGAPVPEPVANALPGIMAIDIVPTIGRSEDINSGVNLAAKSIFTAIRRANQGKIDYDPADVMLYMLGIDSVVLMMAHLRRALRVVQNFEWKNRYTSDALLQAMGVAASDLRKNMGNYVTRMDIIATKAQKLIYLRDFPLIADHAMMFSEVFADGEDTRAQLYVLRPHGYYLMTHLPPNPERILTYTNIESAYSSVYNFSWWLDTVETMINNIAYVNTYSTIAGQIEKAYGPNVVQLPLTGSMEPLKPVYNSDFGWVLQNSNIVNVEDYSLNIYESLAQDANLGALICKPEVVHYAPELVPVDRVLYTTHDSLSAEEIYQATRWMAVQIPVAGYTRQMVIGSEFITGVKIYHYNWSGGICTLHTHTVKEYVELLGTTLEVSWSDAWNSLVLMSLITNFKWYPFLPIVGKQDSNPYFAGGTIGNIDNYTTVTGEMLATLQDIRQLENFYIENLTSIS